jgi:hypothetical protein
MKQRFVAMLVVALSLTPSCRLGDGLAESLPTANGAPTSTRLPDGGYRVWPHSAPAERSRVYAFTLSTHCGLDFLVDFDGSFWDLDRMLAEGNERLGNPEDDGRMTLVKEGEAVYESWGGTKLTFRRAKGPKDVFLCS